MLINKELASKLYPLKDPKVEEALHLLLDNQIQQVSKDLVWEGSDQEMLRKQGSLRTLEHLKQFRDSIEKGLKDND